MRLVPRNIARYRVHGSQLTRTHADGAESKDGRIRSMLLGQVPPELRARYVEAAARVRVPSLLSDRIRAVAHRAMFACMPDAAARGIVRAYHGVRADGL